MNTPSSAPATADDWTQADINKPQSDILLWLLRIFVLLIPLSIFAAIASVEHSSR